MLNIFIQLLLILYVFFLPGFMITRVYFKKEAILATVALSFGLSIVIIPIAAFTAALVLQTTVQKPLLYMVSTAISSAYFFLNLKAQKTCPKCKE